MAKQSRQGEGFDLSQLGFEIGALICFTISILIFTGMVGFTKGVAIEAVVRALRYLFGIGSYAIPIFTAIASVVFGLKRRDFSLWNAALSTALLFWAFVGFIHLTTSRGEEFAPLVRDEAGGIVGGATAYALRQAVGEVGGYIVLTGVCLCALLIGTRPYLTDLTVLPFRIREWVEYRTKAWRGETISQRRAKRSGKLPHQAPSIPMRTVQDRGDGKGTGLPVTSAETGAPSVETSALGMVETSSEPTIATVSMLTAKPRRRKKPDSLLPEHFNKIVGTLDKPTPSDIVDSETDSERGIRLVEDTLASFRIEAKVVNVKRGPVVTRYEVQPAPGIRVNRIVNLADDLALALSAIDVRVEAPVPGKSVIGIEVPNKRVALVRIRELLELEEFKTAPSKATFALGKDIAGNPKLTDLSKMPHLLIGGATNSGKSVCLNSIIVSILSRAYPDEVKLSLIDPKRVELTLFNKVPHLLHPVVVDAKGAIRALRGAISEMERRYRLFSEKGVRNMETYNAALSESENEEPLYRIVILIDELADLMIQAASEFERLICRIAQLARATGIHLVIATQRPSVNVITGVIKANIPSRIAFAVASQVDSRTIIDVNGAERLIGRGDMLFYPIDAPKPVRIQGAFVSEAEINRVCEVLLREYGEPDSYPLEFSMDDEAARTPTSLGKVDELFEQAVELVRRRGYASASMLQREFEIGYPRAGKIIDQLEKAGIIGPQEGSKPRKVLLPELDGELFEDYEASEDEPGEKEETGDGYNEPDR